MLKTNSFVWTDDEVELFLNTVLEYKTSKAAESCDWESVYTKYNDIHEAFMEKYPDREEAEKVGKEDSRNSSGSQPGVRGT